MEWRINTQAEFTSLREEEECSITIMHLLNIETILK